MPPLCVLCDFVAAFVSCRAIFGAFPLVELPFLNPPPLWAAYAERGSAGCQDYSFSKCSNFVLRLQRGEKQMEMEQNPNAHLWRKWISQSYAMCPVGLYATRILFARPPLHQIRVTESNEIACPQCVL